MARSIPKNFPQGIDGGIDEEFGRGEISRWCVFVASMFDAVATNNEPNAIFLFFLLSIISVNARVCW